MVAVEQPLLEALFFTFTKTDATTKVALAQHGPGRSTARDPVERRQSELPRYRRLFISGQFIWPFIHVDIEYRILVDTMGYV